jgi:hypothetical protein
MNTLVLALLDLAVRITRWIVRRLARWALKRVVGWMRKRIKSFYEQLAVARTERRQRWLRGRIERWTKASVWVELHATKALGEAAREVCDLKAFRKLPDYASCEKWTKAA